MAREVIGLRVDPAVVVLLNDHAVKYCLNVHAYTHKPGMISTLVREASFCSVGSQWEMC